MIDKPVLLAAGIEQLDPLNCGSSVAYHVKREGSVSGEIELSDCNRKVTWYFDDETGAEKLDKAIAMLTKFRSAFKLALKQHPRPKKETK